MKFIITKSALAVSFLALSVPFASYAASQESQPPQEESISKEQKELFKPFTGQIIKNRVRMRLTPSLESPVLKELNQGEMIVVVDEDEEFYAVKPPEDIKGYVFRTYVLDGVVEGHHVNVRLEPTLDSPIIAQLTTGDLVTGRVSPSNNKWLEIHPPEGSYFYISKDYIEKMGDANYMTKMNKRRDEVNQLLDNAAKTSHRELNRPFEEVDDADLIKKYENVIANYAEFEPQVARAKQLLSEFKDQYTKRKIAYLEAKSKEFIDAEFLQRENRRLAKSTAAQSQNMNETGQPPNEKQEGIIKSIWSPREERIYQNWQEENSQGSMHDFYAFEQNRANTLKGVIQAYDRNVKNKPGDYLLLNSSHKPVAFLYSTKVNLQDFVGQEITIVGASRPNYHFAYPAYFVLSVQ